MFSRLTFLVLAVFWLTMTYLLWRSEYASQNQAGSVVPVNLVWHKILNASDPSSLQVLHNGKKVGYCRWSSSIGEDLASTKILEEDAGAPSVEGIEPHSGSTRLDLEGNVAFSNAPSRLQVHCEVRLETNNDWQEFHLRLVLKPSVWEIHSVASKQTVRLQVDGPDGKLAHEFTFAELQDPQALMREFDVPAPLGMLGMLNPLSLVPGAKASIPNVGLQWKARNDWVAFGHTPVKAFRLEATVLERYRMRIIVSQVGEILRVELPDGWQLINDQLINL